MKPAQLWKAALTCACLFFASFAHSQSASLSYFEASAQAEDGNASALRLTAAIDNFESADSLGFVLTDGSGQAVYTASNTVTAWKSLAPFRVEDGVLYLTIEAGTFSGLGAYTAEARLKAADGQVLVYTNR